jgi:hypothetical protein
MTPKEIIIYIAGFNCLILCIHGIITNNITIIGIGSLYPPLIYLLKEK